jgi:SH3-like domain-containing protein
MTHVQSIKNRHKCVPYRPMLAFDPSGGLGSNLVASHRFRKTPFSVEDRWVCLQADERMRTASCGTGDYIVVNVRGDDPDHGLNVRDTPDIKGIAVGLLPPNTTDLPVGGCDAGWCEVQCKGAKGWSRDRYLSLRSSALYSVTGISHASIGLAIRNGPDQACSTIGSVPYNGQGVILHSCQVNQDGNSRWCLVTYESRSGWVPLENLTHQN